MNDDDDDHEPKYERIVFLTTATMFCVTRVPPMGKSARTHLLLPPPPPPRLPLSRTTLLLWSNRARSTAPFRQRQIYTLIHALKPFSRCVCVVTPPLQ